MIKIYPKILIIGETFHSKSGGGITLSNLFCDWDKDNLANAIDYRNHSMNLEFSNINIYELYESKFIFNFVPFKYIRRFMNSSVSLSDGLPTKRKGRLNTIIKKIFFLLLNYSGLRHIIFRYKVKQEFLDWIYNFNPDYIYCQLASREIISFIYKINSKTNIPIAIHIMDDWPTTISSNGLFKNYWSNKIDQEFRKLLDNSSVFLSISESMSEEYYKRYNKKFTPFHNPLDLSFWDSLHDSISIKNDNYVFLHAGRIGLGISKSLLLFAKVLQSINDKGINVNMQLQSSNIDASFIEKISQYSCVNINPPAKYEEIPSIMKSADFLLICNDFDAIGEKFLKYSMPTKASEYMICNRPIIIFGPETNAVYKLAEKYNLAFLIGENNSMLLEKRILELLNNKSLSDNISKNAYEFAKENYNAVMVRESFRKIFLKNG